MVLVVLGATMSRRKRLDGLPVSMVLTSQAHRRRPPQKNRRIPTIPTGCFDGRIVHVSAVDTGPRRSEPVDLTAETGISATGPPPAPCAGGPVEGRPFEITDMALPAACAGARKVMVRRRPCPESVYSTRVGIY